MNGVHDMGGMHGFGKVEPEPNEPVFHTPWEARVMAMNRALGLSGIWNIDMTRAALERMPPHVYLSSSYYQRWFLRLEKQLVDLGYVGADEVAAGHALHPGKQLKRKVSADDIRAGLARASFSRPAAAPAKFKIGDRVRTVNFNPATHTRLPRYARDRTGVIERVHGSHVFPDTVATGQGENPQWLYTVVFESRELWGPEADPTSKVSIEAFEPYLQPA
jgi:nitrile hydratase beta subunit